MTFSQQLPHKLNHELEAKRLALILGSEVDQFLEKADTVSLPAWPEFMMHDEVANQNWAALNQEFAEYQFALCEKDSGKWIAVGNAIPVHWSKSLDELPDKGWDWALESGMNPDLAPNLLCALAIQVLPEKRGAQLSSLMVRIMRWLGHKSGFSQLIAPVRPSSKHNYPLLAMEQYLSWKKGAESFDPWLRVHERQGARFLKICPEAMCISGRVAEWESWTDMSFQDTGEYVIPGALTPVKMNIEKDVGVYVEPNVWFVHTTKISE